jgi:hypothetical protein
MLASPSARACAISLAGHLLAVLILATNFTAVKARPYEVLGLSSAFAEQSETNLDRLESQTIDDFEASDVPRVEIEPAGRVAEPVLEIGEVQAAGSHDMFGDGESLALLADEVSNAASLTAGLAGGDKRFGNSVNFYGIDADGQDFVFVVDCSGSMSGTPFQRAKKELQRSVENLAWSQRYFIFFFSDDAYPMPGDDLIKAVPENVLDTRRWLKRAVCGGGTNPLPALLAAINLQPDAIFLLSDGEFDADAIMQVDAAEPATPIPIHTIGFVSRQGEPMLKALSQVTGGTYRFVR